METEVELLKSITILIKGECRACTQLSDTLKVLNSAVDGGDTSLLDVFAACTGLHIVADENEAPTAICGPCELELLAAFRFREKCRRADKHFRQRISEADAEEELDGAGPVVIQPVNIFIKPDEGNDDDEEDGEEDPELTAIMEVDSDRETRRSPGADLNCLTCDRSFTTKAGLARHSRACGKITPEYRRPRKMRPMEDLPDEYECHHCGRVLKNKDSFRLHLTLHGEKKFKCKTCGKKFPQIRYLRTHLLSHQEKTHKCLNCNAAYTQNALLRRHLRNKRECRLVHFGGRQALTKVAERTPRRVKAAAATATVEMSPPASPVKAEMESDRDFSGDDDVEDSDNEPLAKIKVEPREIKAAVVAYGAEERVEPIGEEEFFIVKAEEGDNGEADEEPTLRTDEDLPFCYICEICGKKFQQLRYIRQHMNVHKEIKRYKCLNCNATYSLGNTLNRHLKRNKDCRLVHYAGGKNVPKRNRDLILKDLDEMMKNPAALVPKRELAYECDQCDRKYESIRQLKTHMHVHEENRSVRCKKCKMEFERFSALEDHRREHPECRNTGTKITVPRAKDPSVVEGEDYEVVFMPSEAKEGKRCFKCKTCDQVVVHLRTIRSHVLNHKGIKNFICSTCGKGFITVSALKEHYNYHTGERPYKCKYCNKAYAAAWTARSHQQSCAYRGDAKLLLCTVCGGSFKHKVSLRAHMEIHFGEKKFVCELCGKRFRRRSEMQTHRLSHTGYKRFKCHACPKEFANKKTLVAHLIVHTDTPFRCRKCDLAFSDRELLRDHRRAYHGTKGSGNYERPPKRPLDPNARVFPCPVCDKEFRQTNFLRRHLMTHTAKNFQCKFCGKTFKMARWLELHISEKHHTNPYGTPGLVPAESDTLTLIQDPIIAQDPEGGEIEVHTTIQEEKPEIQPIVWRHSGIFKTEIVHELNAQPQRHQDHYQ